MAQTGTEKKKTLDELRGTTDEKCRSGRPSVLSNGSLEDIRAHLLQSPIYH
jgi:hypothetical protein